MTSIRRFAPPELLTVGAGIVLLIGMLAFPWYHEADPWVVQGAVTASSAFDHNVLGGPGGYLGLAAVVLLIVLLAELIYSRLAPPRLPNLPVAWATAELVTALAVGLLLVARMLVHLGDFGWGFYPVMGAAMVLAYGAFAMGRGSSVRPANVLAGRLPARTGRPAAGEPPAAGPAR
ncbi:MAG TPA: hypothetical protein VF204_03925 [Streptosporangiaceae bacterium]